MSTGGRRRLQTVAVSGREVILGGAHKARPDPRPVRRCSRQNEQMWVALGPGPPSPKCLGLGTWDLGLAAPGLAPRLRGGHALGTAPAYDVGSRPTGSRPCRAWTLFALASTFEGKLYLLTSNKIAAVFRLETGKRKNAGHL